MNRQSGQGLAEYVIIVIVVAVCVIVGIEFFGGSVGEQFNDAVQKVASLGGDTTVLSKDISNQDVIDTGSESKSIRRNKGDSSYFSIEDDSHSDNVSSQSSEQAISSSESDARAAQIARLQRARISGEDNVYDDVELDWGTLGLFAVFVCAFGLYLVIRYGRSTTKQFEKADDGDADEAAKNS